MIRIRIDRLGLGLALIGLIAGGSALAVLVFGRDPAAIDVANRLTPPSPTAPFGADQLGRDVWSRAGAGFFWSFAAAAIATALAAGLGAAVGLAAAEARGALRMVLVQAMSMVLAFPGLVAALVAAAVLGSGLITVALILGLLTWPAFARVAYAEAQATLASDYVAAARMAGLSTPRILWRHVLPSVRGSLFAITAFHFAEMMIAEGALSFLGVGAPLDAATWGNMLSEARPYLHQAPWMLAAPAGALVATVIALNLIGDGIAQRLDAGPRT
jgi:peptide/nickel transport system permease protein